MWSLTFGSVRQYSLSYPSKQDPHRTTVFSQLFLTEIVATGNIWLFLKRAGGGGQSVLNNSSPCTASSGGGQGTQPKNCTHGKQTLLLFCVHKNVRFQAEFVAELYPSKKSSLAKHFREENCLKCADLEGCAK